MVVTVSLLFAKQGNRFSTVLLKNATSDTTKLNIYMALANACEKKDKLNYAEPAWTLVDKLFVKEKKEAVREKLIEKENVLPDLITGNYSNNKRKEVHL